MSEFVWRMVSQKPPRGWKDAFDKASKGALLKIGKYHVQTVLPQHFMESAYQKYGAQTRTTKYDKRKRNKLHHKKPLVWTGTLRKHILHGAKLIVTAKRLVIELTGPSWLKGYTMMRGKRGNAPDKEKEITVVLKSEAELYMSWMQKDITKALKNAPKPKTTSVS